ncbi:MAG: hypothetical protein N3E49_00195 [Bacteroidia bacterium]|nr:hypothetical protein [Bacteroidia bacterium]
MFRTLLKALGLGILLGYGWRMLLNTTFGQNPFEVQAVRSPSEAYLWILFSPASYIQAEGYCMGRYDVEILVRNQQRPYVYHRRSLFLRSTSAELPETSNLFSWKLPPLPETASWEVVVWDQQTRRVFFQTGSFSSEQWAVAFSEVGQGFASGVLLASLMVLYHLPAGTYLGQAALYQSASTLPELRRYLSIEERRFTLHASGRWDTLRLNWRVEDLPSNAYLIGLYLYKGEELQYQYFYSVRRR